MVERHTYRTQEYRDLCHLCDTLSSERCLRCGAPLCSDHKHDRAHRCLTCEHEYGATTLLEVEIRALQRMKTGKKLDALLMTVTFLALAGGVGAALAAISAFSEGNSRLGGLMVSLIALSIAASICLFFFSQRFVLQVQRHLATRNARRAFLKDRQRPRQPTG